MCNTIIPGGQAPADRSPSPWLQWVQSAEFEPTITHLGASVLSVMKRIGFERIAHVDETWVRAYAAPFSSVEECRGALQFPRNITAPETWEFLTEVVKNGDAVAFKALPAMCVQGEADRAIPTATVVGGFQSLWPNGPVVTLPGVGHFLQEDAPEAVTALIEQFVQMTPRSTKPLGISDPYYKVKMEDTRKRRKRFSAVIFRPFTFLEGLHLHV